MALDEPITQQDKVFAGIKCAVSPNAPRDSDTEGYVDGSLWAWIEGNGAMWKYRLNAPTQENPLNAWHWEAIWLTDKPENSPASAEFNEWADGIAQIASGPGV